jgi:hypothetical protein
VTFLKKVRKHSALSSLAFLLVELLAAHTLRCVLRWQLTKPALVLNYADNVRRKLQAGILR